MPDGSPIDQWWECLNCGETPESLKRQGITMCAIVGGYEYREIEHEFAHHRWADWRDRELDLMGIKPEAYGRHRRTPALHIQWVSCEDTKRGHVPATEESDWADYGCRIGQCIKCGQVPGSSEPCSERYPDPADDVQCWLTAGHDGEHLVDGGAYRWSTPGLSERESGA